MKLRIRFSKQGSLKFIGHLDIMRYFQRALRRADVRMRYSEGFNPHPVMSFAAPLGVGLTSDGEYVDIEVTETLSSREMTERINSVLTDEMRILSYRMLPDHAPKAMAQVAAADYTVRFYPGKEPDDRSSFINGIESFLERGCIPVEKESKSGRHTVDIRPMIYEFTVDEDMTVKMKAAAGSAANLKPEVLIGEYADHVGWHMQPVSLLINRDELYAEGTDSGRFVSLETFGKEI